MTWNDLPPWIRWPGNTVAWVAAKTWTRTRRSRNSRVRLLWALAALIATTATALIAAAAAITASLAAVPAKLVRHLHEQHRRRTAQPAGRTRPRSPATRQWPQPRNLATAVRQLIDRHRSADPGLPAPVGIFAGRYQGAIMWRDDVETFGAYLLKTDQQGQLRYVWLGTNPAQYPTVETLAEALNAYGIGLDPASYDLARSYQLDVWDRIGSCTLTGTSHDDGTHHLTVITPNGHTQPLAPATERDERSAAFGAPTSVSWGDISPGSLETARLALEYTGSTTRTAQQLFDDARSLVITSARHWPPDFAIDLASIQHWGTTRNPIAHRSIDSPPTPTAAADAPQTRPARQRPQATERPAPRRGPRGHAHALA